MNAEAEGILNGLNQLERRRQVTDRGRTVAHLHECPHREDEQHRELDPEQRLLEVGRHLDTDVADHRHDHDPQDADQQHPSTGGVGTDPVGPEQQEDVLPGDLGQAGHHQYVGGDDGPPAHPAGLGTEGPHPPGEGRPAVRVGVVHLLVAVGDEQHRHEGEHRDRRGLQSDRHHDEAEGRRQAVGGGGGGDADHRAGDQAERTRLESLVLALGYRCAHRGLGHGFPPRRDPREPGRPGHVGIDRSATVPMPTDRPRHTSRCHPTPPHPGPGTASYGPVGDQSGSISRNTPAIPSRATPNRVHSRSSPSGPVGRSTTWRSSRLAWRSAKPAAMAPNDSVS